MPLPEPCLRDGPFEGCRSPVACEGFGYCRERNKDDRGVPSDNLALGRRMIAARRKREAAKVRA